MANEQNLKPGGHIPSKEEAAKGGRNSGKKRRLAAAIERALNAKTPPTYDELFKMFGIEAEDEKIFASAIGCALVNKAASGNIDAIQLARDTIGEKPKDEIDLNGGVVIVDDITSSESS